MAWSAAGAVHAVSFPLVILLLTTTGNGLLNGMLAPLLGLNAGFRQSFLLVLATFAVASLVLGALSPVVLFLVWNTPPLTGSTRLFSPEYGVLQLTLAAFLALAGVTGNLHVVPLFASLDPQRAGGVEGVDRMAGGQPVFRQPDLLAVAAVHLGPGGTGAVHRAPVSPRQFLRDGVRGRATALLSMNMHPMTLLNMAGRRGMIAPLLVLIAASGVSVSLVVAHIVWTENLRYAFLVWNLFLAWLPLYFALHACEERPPGRGRSWRVTALAGAWLFFLPNSPYIFTDLIHLQGHFRAITGWTSCWS